MTSHEDHAPDKIFAPWSPEVAAALNHYQNNGAGHPFTCGRGRGQDRHHESGVSLAATGEGWHCPRSDCDYTQTWAWTFMARGNHSDR